MLNIKLLKKAGLTDAQIEELVGKTETRAEKTRPAPEFLRDIVCRYKVDNQGNYVYDMTGRKVITGLRHNRFAKIINENVTIIQACSELDSLYYLYDEDAGVYRKLKEDDILSMIAQWIEEIDIDQVTTHNKNEIFNCMKDTIRTVEIEDLNDDANIINFENGILKLDTLELVPHSPDYLSTIQMPLVWDEELAKHPERIKTPKFDEFLDNVAWGHGDSEEGIKTLMQEAIGVSISNVPGYKFKTSLLLVGKGNTGKTTVRDFVISLIGQKNTSAVELTELETREGPSKCFGVRLAGSGDLDWGTARSLSAFKNIVGGDPVTIRYLYHEGFSSKLKCFFWNNANQLPKFGGDKGDHVYARFTPIVMKKVIPDEDRDPNYINKLLSEKEGIVIRCVLAAKEAIKRDYKFTTPQSVKDTIKKYQAENNIVLEWLEEYCEKEYTYEEGGDGITGVWSEEPHTAAQIRKAFENWARTNYGRESVPSTAQFEKSILEYYQKYKPERLFNGDIKKRTSGRRGYVFDADLEFWEEYGV